jgi:hypothetical protein
MTSTGTVFQINVGGNLYFSNHIGFFYELGYAGRSYRKINICNESTNPQEQEWVDGKGTISTNDDESVQVNISGVDIRVGLALKFFL